MLRIWLLAALISCPIITHAAVEPAAVDEAFQELYNFHFQAAHEVLDRYIAAHSQEPLPYAVRASAYLFYELDRMGILESEFLIDDKRIARKEQARRPDPRVRAQFIKALDDAQSRAEATLKSNPNDKAALFALCIAQGVTTDYMAFVEKRQFRSLSPAERSNSYAQRLLRLDPKFYDAYLTAGISEYLVGSLPFFIRWFVHFDNVNGNKTKGVQNLETVAHDGHYLKPFGKILLGIIDLREKKYREAQKLLMDLAHDYPENPLFRKELGKLNAKLGDTGN
jgi:tetratricopeptide (TPR) repeat protein